MEPWPKIRPVGPFDNYCDGFGMPGAAGLGYVSTMKVSTGLSDLAHFDGDLELAASIVAYDKAEKNGAYIGQINMGDASSFCGPMGKLWGYDLAVPSNLRDQLLMTLIQADGNELPVYSADPLLDATQELFGVESKRRFPPAPGSYVLCANKSAMGARTPYDHRSCGDPVNAVWCYLAVSIASDRHNSADLFVEDAGTSTLATSGEMESWLASHVRSVANSIVACGADQGGTFRETFISWAYTMIPEGHAGIALACAPYVTLAKNAVVGGRFDSMLGMSLSEWLGAAGEGVSTD